MNRVNYVVVAIASAVMSKAVDGQAYRATTNLGLKIRIEADTTWIVFKNGDSTRATLKGDTLVENAKRAGTSSTVAWLLGPDSARVLRYEGRPPAQMTMPTAYVMKDWDFAQMYRQRYTGVEGATHSNDKRGVTTRILGDTVWMDRTDGETYRSVLRGDTLRVLSQKKGQRPREETWLVKGDSAYMIDGAGKVLKSLPKRIVLINRELARIQQSYRPVRP